MKTIFAFIESKKEKKIIKNIKSCLNTIKIVKNYEIMLVVGKMIFIPFLVKSIKTSF